MSKRRQMKIHEAKSWNCAELADDTVYTVSEAIYSFYNTAPQYGMETEWDKLEDWQKLFYLNSVKAIAEECRNRSIAEINSQLPFILEDLVKRTKEVECPSKE